MNTDNRNGENMPLTADHIIRSECRADGGVITTMSRRSALALCSVAGLVPDGRGHFEHWDLDDAVSIAVVLLTSGRPVGR